GDEGEEGDGKSGGQVTIVVSRFRVYEGQQKFDRSQGQDEPEPKLLAVYAALWREIEFLEVHRTLYPLPRFSTANPTNRAIGGPLPTAIARPATVTPPATRPTVPPN